MSFEKALAFVLHWEGGYVDDPLDPGGPTAFGISSSAYPNEVATMTRERAAEIYRQDYWDAIRAYDLPPALAVCVMDYAVNSGVRRAATALQRAVNVSVDAKIGPQTLAAVQAADTHEVVEFVLHDRASFLLSLEQRRFERGWIRRVVSLALEVGGMEDKKDAE